MSAPTTPARIVRVRVSRMDESTPRTTYYVSLDSDEGFAKQVEAHRTSLTLTREEARDRALIDAAGWGDFLGLPVEPFVDTDGQEHKPSILLTTYHYRRARAAKAASL